MRKLYRLGMLTILLSLVASPVFAGNEPLCEPLKDGASKGLYGLCIAYHNAENSNAEQKILDNYNKKAGPGDPPMPGTEPEELVSCPCWTTDDMANANIVADPFECQLSVDPVLAGYGELAEVVFSVNLFGPASCFYFGPSALRSESYLSAEQEQVCRDGIQALVDEDFTDIPCT